MNRFSDGESSGSDKSNEERPLKKARFVWEVKGKHHLKEALQSGCESRNNTNNEYKSHEDLQKSSIHFPRDNTNNNNNICNQESCVTNCSRDHFKSTIKGITTEFLNEVNSNDCFFGEIPVPIPEYIRDANVELYEKIVLRNEEINFRNWHKRKLTQCYVDNTINSMLENLPHGPPNEEEPMRMTNVDEILVRGYSRISALRDGHLEDDGIRMAIQSHGLYSHSDSEHFSDDHPVFEETPYKPMINPVVCNDSENAIANGSNKSIMYGMENMENNIDILDAAISMAIHNKGLAPHPCG